MKIGYQGAYHVDNRAQEGGNNDLTYRFNNGMPNQLTQRLEAYRTYSRVRYNALYLQDQWTRGRLTLSGAVRYDHSWSYYPEQSIGGQAYGSCRAVHLGRDRRASSATTTSRRAWASPTTCSATARRPSKFNVGQVSRGRRQRQRQLLGAAAELAHRPDADAHLDRLQRQLRSRLRSVERRRAEPDVPPAVTSAARGPTRTSARPSMPTATRSTAWLTTRRS